jgi:hypothetical protein
MGMLIHSGSLSGNQREREGRRNEMGTGTFNESEITIAAFLWCRGLVFLGCVPDDDRRNHLLFEFEDQEGRATGLRREFLNCGQVAAKQYAAALWI